jgi:restriction system protein
MLPLLKFAGDGKEHSSKETVHALSQVFNLMDEEKTKLYETKKVSIFYDRVHWALTYLKHANLISGTRWGFFKITDRGQKILLENIDKIDDKFLAQFPEFQDFQGAGRNRKDKQEYLEKRTDFSNRTPLELLEESHKIISNELANDLLNNVKSSTPTFFERLVVELLVAMGYGGSIVEAGKAIGRSGDEGIDGIIKEDVLGLDQIYVQAKKWEGTVSRPDIQKFAGALQGQRARKGIFITTGTFSGEAREYVSKIDSKIVLIDGNELSDYMINNNIGVTLEKPYLLKKIDQDYFEET